MGSSQPGGAIDRKHGQQVVGVVVDRPDVVLLKEQREDLLHHLAVFENIAHARRRPAVVLEHQVVAVGIADQVDARDMDVNVPRHLQPDAFAAVTRWRQRPVRGARSGP